jgi:hypothetical protein
MVTRFLGRAQAYILHSSISGGHFVTFTAEAVKVNTVQQAAARVNLKRFCTRRAQRMPPFADK